MRLPAGIVRFPVAVIVSDLDVTERMNYDHIIDLSNS